MIALFGMIVYLVYDSVDLIHRRREYTYEQKSLNRNEIELAADTRKGAAFAKSLRFAFGANFLPEGIDVMDNDYFEFKAYRNLKGDFLKEDPNYEVVRCTDERKGEIVRRENFYWY